MELDLQGKTAVVTGATLEIGRGIVKALAREGVRVLAVACTEQLLQALAQETADAGGARPDIAIQDFAADDSPLHVAEKAFDTLGWVDILVNIAGDGQPVSDLQSDAYWNDAMRLDFGCHRQLTQALLPDMIDRQSGRIITMSGRQVSGCSNAVLAASVALAAWSKVLSYEVGRQGITSNYVDVGKPGILDPLKRFNWLQHILAPETPSSDAGRLEAIANAVTFLASGAASAITGIVLPVGSHAPSRWY